MTCRIVAVALVTKICWCSCTIAIQQGANLSELWLMLMLANLTLFHFHINCGSESDECMLADITAGVLQDCTFKAVAWKEP